MPAKLMMTTTATVALTNFFLLQRAKHMTIGFNTNTHTHVGEVQVPFHENIYK